MRAMFKAFAGNHVELTPEHYRDMGNRDILARMQDNIKSRLVRRERWDDATRVLDTMLLFAPGRTGLWREAGMLLARLDRIKDAVRALEEYLRRTGAEDKRYKALVLLQDLRRDLSEDEDLLIRWHRMLGDETLWLPGLDHAGIATQSVVEADLAKEGLTRHDLGRDAFVERVWQWVGRYRSRIELQLRKMGASADWDKTVFTLDEGPQDAVRRTFLSLHEAGKIRRGHRIINWDPELRTAVSDLEVEYEEVNGHLWYVRYPFVDEQGNESDQGVTIATTRPETIPADVALAVNPKDERYSDLIGRRVRVPLPGFTRAIPIVADSAVDLEFGDVGHLLVGQGLAHAAVEGLDILARVAIVEAEHGLGVVDGGKFAGGLAADAAGGRVGSFELGMGFFESLELC